MKLNRVLILTTVSTILGAAVSLLLAIPIVLMASLLLAGDTK